MLVILLIMTFINVSNAYSGELEKNISTIIKTHSINMPHESVLSDFEEKKLMTEEQLSFIRKFDPYGEIVTSQEIKNYIRLKEIQPGGLGMDIVAGEDGHIICIPYPRSPAAAADIRYGDILDSINEKKISDITKHPLGRTELASIASLLRGKLGEPVKLGLIRPKESDMKNSGVDKGTPFEVTVRRANAKYPTIGLLNRVAGFFRVRIYRFSHNTPKELDDVLKKIPRNTPLILDLRGNTGGDLASALTCVARFLHKHAVIVERESRTTYATPVTQATGSHSKVDIYIWQDALTASSAEVCIAALKQNNRAVSIGFPSAGKACAQEWFRLSNGSQLKLTTELFFTPQEGKSWQDIGLVPDVPIKKGETFEQVMKELVEQKCPLP